jgi:hypothetical protein
MERFCAKEVAKFCFRANKQFVGTGSCVVDLEQWTGFNGAATSYFS